MFNKIYEEIKKYNTIVIARHIGVDPDALSSQVALKESILETFKNKKVFIGGSGSSRFNFIGKLDKIENIDYDNTLLIVLDTPDKKRVDLDNIDLYKNRIKIDHHPFIEEFCNIELIDDNNSSTCQIIMELLYETKLVKNKSIMTKLLIGIISDTNRFLFQNTKLSTLKYVVKTLEEYKIDITKLYEPLYLRPINEIRLEGFIAQNFIITDNKLGYIKISDDIINSFKVDSSSAGNMVNNFNYINELLVWMTISEDKKNSLFKINMRSRGPVINTIAEKYNGGGHKYASGARLKTMAEIDKLIKDLDKACKKYIEGRE